MGATIQRTVDAFTSLSLQLQSGPGGPYAVRREIGAGHRKCCRRAHVDDSSEQPTAGRRRRESYERQCGSGYRLRQRTTYSGSSPICAPCSRPSNTSTSSKVGLCKSECAVLLLLLYATKNVNSSTLQPTASTTPRCNVEPVETLAHTLYTFVGNHLLGDTATLYMYYKFI